VAGACGCAAAVFWGFGLHKAIQWMWGLWAVSGFVLLHPVVLNWGMTDVLPIGEANAFAAAALPYVWVLTGVLALVLIVALRRKPGIALMELTEMAVLFLLFSRTDFYVSFGLFFGGWHALTALYNLRADIRPFQTIGWRRLALEALPHTVGSVVGIGLLLLIAEYGLGLTRPAFFLFMALSVVAFPHIVMLEEWHGYLRKRREQPGQVTASKPLEVATPSPKASVGAPVGL
jgi:hypothetical protein